jgi:hypothetical protein
MFTVIFLSCKENDSSSSDLNVDNDSKRNEMTWIGTDTSTSTKGLKEWLARLKIFIGHTIDQCGGKCMEIFGEPIHINCRGFGDVCQRNATIRLIFDEETEAYTITVLEVDALGEDLDFAFPDRSLYITNPQNNYELWLNIPEQLLQRVCDTIPFIINNIWFSEAPELENR